MKKLPFYKLHTWMLAEFGASASAIIYAVIFSFYEFNGTGCSFSRNQWANLLKCGTATAQRNLKELAEDGYILAEPQKAESGGDIATLYTINAERLDSILTENGLTAERDEAGKIVISPLYQNDTTPCITTGTPLYQNDTSPLYQNDTSPCIKLTPPTITENKTEIIHRERGAQSAPTRGKKHFSTISESYEEQAKQVFETFTAEQNSELASLAKRAGKAVDHYKRRFVVSCSRRQAKPCEAFMIIQDWIASDAEQAEMKARSPQSQRAGAPSQRATARQRAGEPSQQSFTDDDLESLVNLF